MYPRLDAVKTIALDIETHDPNLKELGPGYHRKRAGMEDSEILTIAIATEDAEWVFLWSENTKKWLQNYPDLNIIGANVIYDLGWLTSEGVKFNGHYHDILNYESIFDGGRNWYSLDKLAQKYLNQHKENDEIKMYCEKREWKGDPRQHLRQIIRDGRDDLVLKYNKADARQTFEIFEKQKKQLDNICELEKDVLKTVLRFRMQGVRIDVEALEKTRDRIQKIIDEKTKEAHKIVGFEFKPSGKKDQVKAFDAVGLKYPLTDKGNPSFRKDILQIINHPLAQALYNISVLSKLQTTYLHGFKKFLVGDRVYCEFLSLKNGGKGTETGRFSAIRPALQTIPKKGEGKKLIRSLFLPEVGEKWVSQDQSQEEYRLFAHYARGGGAKELRESFTNDPDFDMHQFTSDYTKINNRSLAKALNFGSMYGMGVHKFADQIGETRPPEWPLKSHFDNDNDYYSAMKDHKQYIKENYKAGQLYYGYHDKFSCIKETSKIASETAKNRGWSKTLLGRKRFLKKHECFKALNSVIQGTGGDIMKLWAVGCEKAGLFDTITPLLTVHDSLDCSRPQTKEAKEAAREMKNIGENCIKLRVPLRVDWEEGTSWGTCEKINT